MCVYLCVCVCVLCVCVCVFLRTEGRGQREGGGDLRLGEEEENQRDEPGSFGTKLCQAGQALRTAVGRRMAIGSPMSARAAGVQSTYRRVLPSLSLQIGFGAFRQ